MIRVLFALFLVAATLPTGVSTSHSSDNGKVEIDRGNDPWDCKIDPSCAADK